MTVELTVTKKPSFWTVFRRRWRKFFNPRNLWNFGFWGLYEYYRDTWEWQVLVDASDEKKKGGD